MEHNVPNAGGLRLGQASNATASRRYVSWHLAIGVPLGTVRNCDNASLHGRELCVCSPYRSRIALLQMQAGALQNGLGKINDLHGLIPECPVPSGFAKAVDGINNPAD